MIGSRTKKKCTIVLIPALTSQISGGNAMTPGLSLSFVVTSQSSQIGEAVQITNN